MNILNMENTFYTVQKYLNNMVANIKIIKYKQNNFTHKTQEAIR